MKKKILITGGAGYIGSHISEKLLENHHVRILDNLSTGFKNNIDAIKKDNLEFIYGDICNLETCRKATKNIDLICHQAALGSVPRSVNDPLSSHKNNVDGLFVSCTALKIVDVLDRVESSQNTIVISSNQAIIWDCLRSVGIDSKIKGYGKLFLS